MNDNIVDPGLEQQLTQLVKQRLKNTSSIGHVIFAMIQKREGGVRVPKNHHIVVNYVAKLCGMSKQMVEDYILIGRQQKLPEVFNMNTDASRMAWHLHIEDQRKLVFHGVPVVQSLEKAHVVLKLHQMTKDDAWVAINLKLCCLRSPKEQRKLLVPSVPPGERTVLLEFWPNGWVKVNRRIPGCDLEYVLKELKKRGVKSVSNREIREQLDREIDLLFPQSHGESPA